jgi:hypothetical protein
MRTGGSKDKGSAFERMICRELSLLISKGTRKDLLWRSAMSGGRATIQLRDEVLNQTQAGDISSIDILSHWLIRDYMIECKHYANLEFTSGFLSKTGALYRFWNSLLSDATRRGKSPMLIAKQNNRPIVMLTSPSRSPSIIRPIITLHEWPAEVRLFSRLEELVELVSIEGHSHG